MAKSVLSRERDKSDFSSTKNMLKVKNIKKHFGGVKAVDGCSFEIPDGKITALIGPNGAGKSTVFSLISGNVEQDSGNIWLNKQKLNGLAVYQRAQMGLARTFQSVRLFKNLTIEQNLLLALESNDQKFFSSIFAKEDESLGLKIRETLAMVGLEKDTNTLASDLSYGQQKLLELAKAILLPHSILLLDEPVAGVSPVLRDELISILKMLKMDRETILIIEHDMNFVFEIADRVIVMDQGKVLVEGTPQEIKKNPKVLDVYLGEQL